MTSQLSTLASLTTIVADTGDKEKLAKLSAIDATTNPSLVLQALASQSVSSHLDEIVNQLPPNPSHQQLHAARLHLCVRIGQELLTVVPGRVSTEISADKSFDTQASVEEALELAALYRKAGIDVEKRVLFKLASTWEGMQAARILEKEHGLHVNATLLFSEAQGRIAGEAGVTLISPFVGRISDWAKAQGQTWESPEQDPGVQRVRSVYDYFKKKGWSTIVMGASFRNVGQIRALAGIDYLTISPKLLEELRDCQDPLERALPKAEDIAKDDKLDPEPMSQAAFRLAHNSDPMAVEKLADGIRRFIADTEKLDAVIQERVAAKK